MTEQEQNGANQDVKRWTAKRKAALVLDLIKGTTTVAQAARTYDVTDLHKIQLRGHPDSRT